MSHTAVTQTRPIPMPRQSGLLNRKGRFYLNMRVPKELRPLYGKKDIFRKSLETSDYREAVQRVRYEAFRLESEFAEKRRELERAKQRATEPPPEISPQEAHGLVFRWFIEQEKLSEEWWDGDATELPPERLAETLDILKTDSAVYAGGNENLAPYDNSGDLDAFLKREGIDYPADSPAYRKLRTVFRKAKVENLERMIDRMTRGRFENHDPLFREV